MNGRVSKILRKKAHAFYILKQRQNPAITLKKIYRRMKKLYLAGVISL